MRLKLSGLHPIFGSGRVMRGMEAMPKWDPALSILPANDYVPCRNLLLLALAAGYAEGHGISNIFYGAMQLDETDPNLRILWDNGPDFTDAVNMVLALNSNFHLRLEGPVETLGKSVIVSLAQSLGVPLDKTWSCHGAGPAPCRDCAPCIERAQGFFQGGYT